MKEFIKRHKVSILVIAGFLAIAMISSANNSGSNNTGTAQLYTQPQVQQQVVPSSAPVVNDLSNNNSYTNVDGNSVHSPAYSENGNVPVGASARCGDGTYSFSQNRRGTCSHHGGVETWL